MRPALIVHGGAGEPPEDIIEVDVKEPTIHRAT